MRRLRLGLRGRIALAFALGAFALSAVMAGITYAVVRETLLRQRENVAVDRTYLNARVVRDQLRSTPTDIGVLLTSLRNPTGSLPLVSERGRWFSSSLAVGRDSIPEALRDRVAAGVPARMRYDLNGETSLAIGVPLPSVDAAYYEIVALTELNATLRSVRVALMAAAALTTFAGAAAGIWLGRRVTAPLASAARAAEAIAEGDLDTRLDPGDDRELATLAKSFNRMAQTLQERRERDARFASDVSHELRSPLMTLSASIEIIQARRDEMPERAQAALDLLVADVARFSTLVEDLLEISRFDAGAVRLDLEAVALADLVAHASGLGHDEPPPVVIEPEAQGLRVVADKRRLVRILTNLFDNARIHGGGVARVTVRRAGDVALVEIDDDGPGVPPEERLVVFERFARGAQAGRRGTTDGAGLGLALVDEHVRLLGGRVWVGDRPDGKPGAHFVVELPVDVHAALDHPELADVP